MLPRLHAQATFFAETKSSETLFYLLETEKCFRNEADVVCAQKRGNNVSTFAGGEGGGEEGWEGDDF